MAGAAGFEPANSGPKTRCLTAWRHPIAFSSQTRRLKQGKGRTHRRTLSAPATPRQPAPRARNREKARTVSNRFRSCRRCPLLLPQDALSTTQEKDEPRTPQAQSRSCHRMTGNLNGYFYLPSFPLSRKMTPFLYPTPHTPMRCSRARADRPARSSSLPRRFRSEKACLLCLRQGKGDSPKKRERRLPRGRPRSKELLPTWGSGHDAEAKGASARRQNCPRRAPRRAEYP